MEVEWEKIQNVFGLKDLKKPLNSKIHQTTAREFSQVRSFLKENGLQEIIVNLTLESIWDALREIICPQFWGHFEQYSAKRLEGSQPLVTAISILVQAVKQLHDGVNLLVPYIERCQRICDDAPINFDGKIREDDHLMDHLKLRLRATLYAQLPVCFEELIQEVYATAFRVFCHKEGHVYGDHDTSDVSGTCSGCEMAPEVCQCAIIDQAFTVINGILQELELLERMVGNVTEELLFTAIDDHVTLLCRDNFDKRLIGHLQTWVEKVSAEWFQFVYCRGKVGEVSLHFNGLIKNKQQSCVETVFEKYTRTRIKQLFNILIEYPESQPALDDLRECLERTNLRETLVKSLSKAIETRLLHPGVTTEDILHAYISTIKGLRVLDPKGILLELVSEPIRQYLRGRSDFVRYIAISLTDYSCSELSEELNVTAAPLVLDDTFNDTEDMSSWETWTPDPIHAQGCTKSKSQRTADIISMLVNIYGSKTVFISEYGTILADRILSQYSYDTQKEIMYLEHLKVRFGDSLAPLHKCEVMVKDVADSKRINTFVHSDQNPLLEKHKFPISSMILSSQFWPSFKEQSLQLPDEVLAEMDVYVKAYQSLKGNRTLQWKPHLGQVELEIELKNRTLSLTVTPTKATIIYHFEKRSRWPLKDLSKATMIPKTILRQKLAFWQAQGLIQEAEPDVFVLVEDDEVLETRDSYLGRASSYAVQETSMVGSSLVEDESESVMASAHDQRQEELQVLWSYIVGMLTNLDNLPLERIHSMLKIFVQDSMECSLEELRTFLETKIRQQKIILTNGMYRLAKN